MNVNKTFISDNVNLYKQYKKIYWVYFVYFLASGPIHTILSYFYFEYFSTIEYGYFLSLNNLVNILLPTIIASVSYKRDVKKINNIGILLSVSSGLAIAFFGKYNVALLIISSLFLFTGRTIFNNSLGNKINYSIKNDELDKFFSVRDLFLFAGISLGTIISSVIIFWCGYSVAFLCFSFILCFCIFQTKKIELKSIEPEDKEEKTPMNKIFALLKDKTVIALTVIYLSSGVYAAAYDFIGQIGLNLGIDVSFLISFSGILVFANALIALFITSFNKIGKRKNFFLFDIAFDLIPALAFALSNNVYFFLFALFLTSIKDVFSPITFAYIISCFDEENGFIALGLLGSISSFISVLFPTIFGYLIMDNYQSLFLFSAILIIISSIIAKIMLPDK